MRIARTMLETVM